MQAGFKICLKASRKTSAPQGMQNHSSVPRRRRRERPGPPHVNHAPKVHAGIVLSSACGALSTEIQCGFVG